MQKKIENIQAIRGVATLFVVFYHIMNTEHKFANSNTILPSFLTIFSSGVDLFFVISGFVIVTVSRGKFDSFIEMLKFMYNRVTRVYSLYWFYTGLLMVYFILPPEMFARSHEDVDIFRSFLLLPQANLPLLVVAWTIVHEMYFYSTFAIFLLFSEKHLTKLLLVWSFFIVVIYFIFHQIPENSIAPTVKIITHPLTFEFIGGCIIAKLIFTGTKIRGLTFFIIGIFLLLANYLLAGDVAMDRWPRLFFFGLPSLLIIYGSIVVELDSNIKLPDYLRFLGDASYSIYLSHYIVLPIIGRLWPIIIKWRHIDNSGYTDNIVAIFVMIVAVLVTGIGSYHFLEKPMLLYTRKLKIKKRSNIAVQK